MGRPLVVLGLVTLVLAVAAPLARAASTSSQLGHPAAVGRLTDGRYLREAQSGRVYVIAGGSPLRVTDCSSLGQACQSAATVGQAAIEQLKRVDPYPRDGTFLRSVNSTFIYRIAGGAPLQITDFSAISGWRHFVNVNQSAIEGLRAYPRDGTLIRVVETGDLYRIKGGLPVLAGNCSSLVSRCRHALALPSSTIDDRRLTDGRYLREAKAGGFT